MFRSWHDALIGLASALAIAALALLAAGPLGWRLGWWHYGLALQSLLPWAAYAGIATVVMSAAALIAALVQSRRGALLAAVVALLAGALAIYMPWQASSMRGLHPRINDISTDRTDPPAFVAALPLRKADGGSDGRYSADSASVQAASYADIVSLKVNLAPAQAFARAADTAAAMPGWHVIMRDPAGGRIEASEASRWFGFVDDIVIRVRGEGTGSRIDVRSASRHGRGDFGVNAKRVREYLAALRLRAPT